MPLYLDIETTGLEDDAAITCAVTLCVSGNDHGAAVVRERRWHGEAGEPLPPAVLRDLVRYLVKVGARKGLGPLVTFNGVGFDLKRLYQALGTVPEDAALAEELRYAARENHLDIMYDLWCDVGYMASLNSFAKAEGLAGKTNSGSWAATSWTGNPEACQQVLDYCAADVAVLRGVYERARTHGRLRRLSKAGRESIWVLPGADVAPHTVRTVSAAHDAYLCHPPNTSWMTDDSKRGTPTDAFAWLV